ncbi:hypothetical protein P691DRAFT_107857 [Macrolepiota fuliginosa MF-IS2]|uniref:Extracellular membrane protein CFEM domain-containing protein n=1 Tax=Macrolepiota fuliginosa MF-IS2 TaxID=1400762 RepID=A0A9P6BWF6_9AGAR|nr:hypothetical protein P691DRAFT_107857 [Macrolepiota fuliginosa MF-IS2]
MWLSVLIASLVFSPLVSASEPGGHGILRRQQDGGVIGQVPEGCKTTCRPIDTVLSGCTNPTCVCTDPNYVALKVCMDCVVDYGTGTPTYGGLRTRGQAVLDGTSCPSC